MECFSTFLPSWKPHPCQVMVRVLCMAATCSQSCGAGKHVNMTPHQNYHLNGQHEAYLRNSDSIHLSYILQSLIEIQRPLKGPQMNFTEAMNSLQWYGVFYELCAVFWDEGKILGVVHTSIIRVKNHHFVPRRGLIWEMTKNNIVQEVQVVLQNHKERSQDISLVSFFQITPLSFSLPLVTLCWCSHVTSPFPCASPCLRVAPHLLKTQWGVVKASPSLGLKFSSSSFC